jgi:hypothetical protein
MAFSLHSLADELGGHHSRWINSREAPFNCVVVHSLDCTPQAKRSCRMTIILFAIYHRLNVDDADVL